MGARRQPRRLASVAAVSQPPCIAGRNHHGRIGAVVALPIEERVEVLTTKGRSVSGTLKAVDFTHLELDPLSIHLPRTDVAAVWKLGRPDRLRNGALVGGAIGLILGSQRVKRTQRACWSH